MRTFYYRKGQPHIQPIGATYSVTMLVHDAVPKQLVDELSEKRRNAILSIDLDGEGDKARRKSKTYSHFEKELENLLQRRCQQENPFRIPLAAVTFLEHLKKYDGLYYHLDAAIVMQNHVHLILDLGKQLPENWDGISDPPNYVPLAKVIGQIKGGSAYDINKALDRKGTLWSKGYYDRYIRSPKHYQAAVWYTLRNAEKAGLVTKWDEYPFVYVGPGILDRIKWG